MRFIVYKNCIHVRIYTSMYIYSPILFSFTVQKSHLQCMLPRIIYPVNSLVPYSGEISLGSHCTEFIANMFTEKKQVALIQSNLKKAATQAFGCLIDQVHPKMLGMVQVQVEEKKNNNLMVKMQSIKC